MPRFVLGLLLGLAALLPDADARTAKASPLQLRKLHALIEHNVAQKAATIQSDGIDLFADVRRQPGAKKHEDELSVNSPDDYFQGDVDLSLKQYDQIAKSLKPGHRGKRKVGKSPFYELWDRRYPISFDFSESIPTVTRIKIRDAMRLWQRNTCIRFEENGPSTDRIEFFDGGGCSSFVGRVGGTQGVSIATPGCDTVGIISHEIGHSLGNFHEQARPDQEKHINVNWNNIPLGRWNNFNPVDDDQADTYGLPYDTGSVMHYGPYGFASDPYIPTIRTIERTQQTTIGQRAGPSFLDYMAINKAYRCNDHCPPIRCERGGYAHPNNCDICQCPDGLAGDHCDYIRQSNQDCGGIGSEGTYISSPFYPEKFPRNTECYWLFKTEVGHTIQLEFDGIFDFLCEDTCDKSYVEVKHHADLRLTGSRFCCGIAPRKVLKSQSNEMLVLMRGYGGSGGGFRAKVWADGVKSGLKPVQTTPKTTTTTTTTITTTSKAMTTSSISVIAPWVETRPSPLIHRITTTQTPRPLTSTQMPDGNIPLNGIIDVFYEDSDCRCSEWSEWIGECSQVCGGCGNRQRTRECMKSDCHTTDKRPCNFRACPEGTNFIFNNGEFHILWRGCCVGMFRSRDECAALEGGENPLIKILAQFLTSSDAKTANSSTMLGEHGNTLANVDRKRAWLDY